jgi:hypothetical protein
VHQEQLDFTIAHLPGFTPPDLIATTPRFSMQLIYDRHKSNPHIVSRPRRLLKTTGKRWIYVVSVGHGPLHTIIDVHPHGGELLWQTASTEYLMWLDENPWLLEGRTVHFLFAGPDAAELNIERWLLRLDRIIETPAYLLRDAIMRHWRHPDPLQNDAWSYPFENGSFRVNQPTMGARAGMLLMREIAESGGQLVAWIAGHNRLVGDGVQFEHSGPHEGDTVEDLEALASRLSLRLDPIADEGPYRTRHPRRSASWRFSTAECVHQYDPTARVGGTPLDWGRQQLFPQMAAHATELGMFQPLHRDPIWMERPVTFGTARAMGDRLVAWLREDIEPVLDISEQLLPISADIKATKAIRTAAQAWGTRRPPERSPKEIISPGEVFQLTCIDPLYETRQAAPALAMMYHHADMIRTVTDQDPMRLTGMLRHAMHEVVDRWWMELVPLRLDRGTTCLILSAEIAAYGARGIRPRFSR